MIHATLILAAVMAVDGVRADERQMENLGRGVVAINQGDGNVYVGWRMLGTDPQDASFDLYRATDNEQPVKLNEKPVTKSTNWVDRRVDLSRSNSYFVVPVMSGKERMASARFTLLANAPARQYLSIPLQTPEGCTPNDASAADLDGDGEYEIVVKQEMRGRDNSHNGFTGQTKLEAYTLAGVFLWRIDLGPNIREGAHYTQFMVYDLDGDGRAEVACKTADGTVDGTGKAMGDPEANWVNENGKILDGPEFFTVFDGRTGAALATTDYIPPRGDIGGWGGSGGLHNCKGEPIGRAPSSTNFVCWWDGDLLRELLDGNRIDKHNGPRLLTADGCVSNNGTKSTPALSADLFGDWREEVMWRTEDGGELRIFTTTIPTTHRFHTLMHDPQYRLSVAWQNVAYNQPPHVGFYLGVGMARPPRPRITTERDPRGARF